MKLPEIYNYLSFSLKEGRIKINCIRRKSFFCEKNNDFLLSFIGNPFIKSSDYNFHEIINLSFCIKKYKKSLNNLVSSIDGSFLIIFVDYKSDLIHVINDRFGAFPFFYNEDFSGIFGSIHSDEVGSKILNKDLDLTSLAEFVRTGTISPGFSFYKEVRSLDYGNILTFDLGKKKVVIKKYFNPSEISDEKYSSLKEAYNDLLCGMKYIQKRYINYFKEIGLLLSGGVDSRSIAIFFKNKCEALSLSSFNNRSKTITKKIAFLLGIKLEFISLEYKQYIRFLEESVFLSGGVSSFIENHYANPEVISKLKRYDLLISGCYFDYVFKGLTTNTKFLKILGIRLPFLVESPRKLYFYKKDFDIEYSLQCLVDHRRNNRYKNIKDKNLLEFERVAPLYLECENIGRRSLFMFTNWNAFVANNIFIDVMLKTPINLKINTRLMRELLFRNSKEIRFIPNSNTGVPIYPNVCIDIIHRGLNFFIRKLKSFFNLQSKRNIPHGSWVFSKEYVAQPEIEKFFWDIDPKDRILINKILGNNIWNNNDFKKIIKNYNQNLIVRIITIGKWLELKRKNNLFKGL